MNSFYILTSYSVRFIRDVFCLLFRIISRILNINHFSTFINYSHVNNDQYSGDVSFVQLLAYYVLFIIFFVIMAHDIR